MKRTELKKLAAILVMSLTLGSLAACGSKDAKADAEVTEAVTEAPVVDEAEAADGTEAVADGTDAEVADGTDAEAADSTEAEAADGAEAVEKHITVAVVDADGVETDYEADTTAEVLYDALVEIDGLTLDGYVGDYGYYITAVNGITADYDADGAYWSVYVNDEYGSYGVDSQPVSDGDSYKLVYEVYVAE